MSSPLYSSLQRVFLKGGASEERTREVRVTLSSSPPINDPSPRCLRVEVTDDNDPFLLYTLLLSQDDYATLKAAQGLLVDFEAFPAQLVRLLEACKAPDPNFLLLLHQEAAPLQPKTLLKIVETNNFKHLCHLVLQVEPGTDSDIKRLMLNKINSLKEQQANAEAAIASLETRLISTTQLLNEKNDELAKVERKWADESISLKAEVSKELIEETDKLRKANLEFQIKAQKEKALLEEKHIQTLKEKEEQLSTLKLDNQVLLEKKRSLEGILNEHVRAIEAFEKETSSLKKENSSLRKQSAKIDSDYHEKEKYVNSLKTRLAVVEQELKDQRIMNDRQQEFLDSANEHKEKLENALEDKSKALHKKEASLKTLTEELAKANEIISKLQKELAMANGKLKVRTGIALEQEKVVESHLKRLTQLEKDLKEKNAQLSSLRESETSLNKTLDEIKELKESQEAKLKEKDKMIDWLNKKLNEQTKSYVCSTGGSSVNGITNIASSTPYLTTKTPEETLSSYSRSNITQLDHLRTVNEEEENVEPAVEVELPPDTSKKKTSSKRSSVKAAKPVGFKRLSPVQPTTIPSSYFLN